jgi:hypothetical protein
LSDQQTPFDLGHPEAPLQRLWSQLELVPPKFTEERRRIVIDPKRVAVRAGLVDEHKGALVELTREYGDALKQSFVDTLYGQIPLEPGLTEEKINEILRKNQDTLGAEFPNRLFPLQVIIDKQRVLEICLERARLRLPPAVSCLYFFFLETFVEELSKPTADLERWWGDARGARLVVLVPRWQGPSMLGSYLAVIGKDYAEAVPRLTTPPGERAVARKGVTVLRRAPPVEERPQQEATERGLWMRVRNWVQEMFLPDATFVPPPEPVPAEATAPGAERITALSPQTLFAARAEKVNWEKAWLTFLTPLHLQMEDRCANDDPAARLLRLHRINLAILFTADRVQEMAAGSLQAVYQTPEMAVAVRLADPRAENSVVDAASTNALAGIAVGLYDGSFKDKLVRSTLGASLKVVENPDQRFERLARRGVVLLEEIQISSLLFQRQELDQFIGQVQALEDYVAETVQAFSDQAAEMIKSLSETMLAAVAVLLGSFVGALLKEDFDSRILVIGAALYLLYLVAFPLSYNMGQRKDSYQALAAQFEARRRLFDRRLYREKVDGIVGDHIDCVMKRFEYWFRRTLLTYWLVAGLLMLFIVGMWWIR